MSYLVIKPADGATPRRVALDGVASLFAEDEPPAPATPPVSAWRRFTLGLREILAPMQETFALLREENEAHRRETRAALASLRPAPARR
jgi:hypothetical protein